MTRKTVPRKLVVPGARDRDGCDGTLGGVIKALLLALLAFAVIGPLANLVLSAFAERWYYPFKLPVTRRLRYWEVVFRPTGVAGRFGRLQHQPTVARRPSSPPGSTGAPSSVAATTAELHINAWGALAGLLLAEEAGGAINDFLANDGLRRGNPV